MSSSSGAGFRLPLTGRGASIRCIVAEDIRFRIAIGKLTAEYELESLTAGSCSRHGKSRWISKMHRGRIPDESPGTDRSCRVKAVHRSIRLQSHIGCVRAK